MSNCRVFALNDLANNKEDSIIAKIAPYVMEGEKNPVRRIDCIVTIMKLIGMDSDAENKYMNIMWDRPIFSDFYSNESVYPFTDDNNEGYIVAAYMAKVVVGTKIYEGYESPSFEPKRSVTVKECLALMLRCLTDPETVSWCNVMQDSVKIGLINEDELTDYIAENPLKSGQFYTLLCRMLNMKRYLYWPATNVSAYEKSMETDKTESITYIDWLLGEEK